MEKLMQERELLKQCSGVDERKWIWPLLGTLTVNMATVIWAQICEWADMVEGDCESALLIVSLFSVKEGHRLGVRTGRCWRFEQRQGRK